MNPKNYYGFIYEWTNKLNNKKYIGKHKGYWITPYGRFSSQNKAAKESNCCVPSLRYRCLNPHKTSQNTRHPKEWRGKTWEELGWGFEPLT